MSICKRRIPILERFLEKIQKDPATECWNWRKPSCDGYGRIDVTNTPHSSALAHRVGWELFEGPIPEGLILDHRCRNRGCVNPDHLRPCTSLENIYAPGSLHNGAKTHCKRGHKFTRKNTYYYGPHKTTRACKKCKKEYHRRRRQAPVKQKARQTVQQTVPLAASPL
jgi:hypothetical protein